MVCPGEYLLSLAVFKNLNQTAIAIPESTPRGDRAYQHSQRSPRLTRRTLCGVEVVEVTYIG